MTGAEWVWAIVVSASSFVFVAVVVCACWTAMAHWRSPVRRRLLASVAPRLPGVSHDGRGPIAALARWFDAASLVVVRALGREPQEHTPGFRTRRERVTLTIVLAVAAWLVGLMAYSTMSKLAVPPLVVWGVTAGMVWAGLRLTVTGWMHWRAQRWIEAINDGLIDVLDLWVLCLGSGMSFQSALVRVVEDPQLTSPVLREQLQLTHQEMLAGCPRDEALRHLARRGGGSADLKALVSSIIQSERLGSSLGKTLRVYAGSLRFKRHQDAKETIQKLSVKLAFPLVFCILPALFVVILGPSLVRMFSVLATR